MCQAETTRCHRRGAVLKVLIMTWAKRLCFQRHCYVRYMYISSSSSTTDSYDGSSKLKKLFSHFGMTSGFPSTVNAHRTRFLSLLIQTLALDFPTRQRSSELPSSSRVSASLHDTIQTSTSLPSFSADLTTSTARSNPSPSWS